MLREAKIADTCTELDALIHDYYDRTAAVDGPFPIDMDWDMFLKLEGMKSTLLILSREDDVLNGFVLYFIHKHHQHNDLIAAQCNTLAVNPDYRGRGIGRHLMAYAEPILHARGVRMILHNYRVIYGVEPLFPKLGYRLMEHIYVKELV